jgi:hypothetical protein
MQPYLTTQERSVILSALEVEIKRARVVLTQHNNHAHVGSSFSQNLREWISAAESSHAKLLTPAVARVANNGFSGQGHLCRTLSIVPLP